MDLFINNNTKLFKHSTVSKHMLLNTKKNIKYILKSLLLSTIMLLCLKLLNSTKKNIKYILKASFLSTIMLLCLKLLNYTFIPTPYAKCIFTDKQRIEDLYNNHDSTITNLNFSRDDEIYLDYFDFNLHVDYMLPDSLNRPELLELFKEYCEIVKYPADELSQYENAINESITTENLLENLISYFAKYHEILSSKIKYIYNIMEKYHGEYGKIGDPNKITIEDFYYPSRPGDRLIFEKFCEESDKYIVPISILLQKIETTEIYTQILGYELIKVKAYSNIGSVPHLHNSLEMNIKNTFVQAIQTLTRIAALSVDMQSKHFEFRPSQNYFSLLKIHFFILRVKDILLCFCLNKENPKFEPMLKKYMFSDLNSFISYTIYDMYESVKTIFDLSDKTDEEFKKRTIHKIIKLFSKTSLNIIDIYSLDSIELLNNILVDVDDL
ncbi:hypothetical protein SLOPH_580 [Spraguea lophii 42_110]|uniref:Uncharacterized protein n=1 Tax=Spraguea lophii (strain 42_110) TaxID=1358809 RepID=S7XPQ5_SPRLO|nr:hypothetical protein SLOPH_580 [Spraguea lophii 42_110]